MYNYVRSPMCIKCCLMVLGDEKFGFKELFLFMQSFRGPWLLLANFVFLPCHSLAQEPPRAMPGLWGHSAQTTACFRVTSAVPVGVGQPGKGLRKPTWKIFQTKSVISFKGVKGKKKIPPTVLLGSKCLSHCLGCI